MTIEELRAKDRELKMIERKIEKRLRTAQKLVAEVRMKFAERMWGLTIGSLVWSTGKNRTHYKDTFVVTRIDTRYSITYGKRLRKPWVTGRKLMANDATENWTTDLAEDWETYDPETD